MPKDKFTAVWVSHTSISDFLSCPRAYYLKNVYKNPKTGHKMKIMSPPFALGLAVHDVVESLSVLPADKRFSESLLLKLEIAWKKVNKKKGGFVDGDSERAYYNRAEEMLRRLTLNPGPLVNSAVKIQMSLPYFWLSEEDNIILCGKIDWLEYLPETEGVHIIDFKTGRWEEKSDSLQLPIYYLLVNQCQKRSIEKVSYWYLGLSNEPVEKKLPNFTESYQEVLKIAKKVKLARQLQLYKCPHGGCRSCLPFEQILKGEAEFVWVNNYKEDVYILPSASNDDIQNDTMIL